MLKFCDSLHSPVLTEETPAARLMCHDLLKLWMSASPLRILCRLLDADILSLTELPAPGSGTTH